MKYTKINWKQNLRSLLFGWLPPSIYLKVVPLYFKMFNPERRGCTYKFRIDKKGRKILYDDETKLYFVDHRRINRYLFPNGLDRIKALMFKKYCTDDCTIDETDTVVEIGANIGEFTTMAAEISKRVFAFEPDPSCLLCLKENMKDFDKVEIIEHGASDVNSEKVFYLSSENADSSFITPKVYSKEITVQAIRIDTWMDIIGIKEIDFLKVEAEGAELEVLQGLGDKIRYVNKISVDGGPERYGKPTFKDVNSFLRSKGFQTNVIGYQVFAWK